MREGSARSAFSAARPSSETDIVELWKVGRSALGGPTIRSPEQEPGEPVGSTRERDDGMEKAFAGRLVLDFVGVGSTAGALLVVPKVSTLGSSTIR